MKFVKTPIIPIKQTFVDVDAPNEFDLKAICIFVAIGFFLDTDTYWKNKKVLASATDYVLNNNKIIESKPWFHWHYTPRDISFEQALDEFEVLFDTIIKEQTDGKSVILPLSGGLDSRTQAAALKDHPNVSTYSYSFENGYPEHKIAKKIADTLKFPFIKFCIPKGYLWEKIENLAEINQCYSDFTHPRQMAFIDEYKSKGDIFSLGHMGDLLFESFQLPQLTFKQEVRAGLKMFIKKGGIEIANELWNSWGLNGNFEVYLEDRITELLSKIKIEDTNAKLRAFKTIHSVTRWSSVNLSVFQAVVPIQLPYYDNRMCEFICTVPEKFLRNRKLQIAYIQRKSPELARIVWHGQKPFNLNNYHLNKIPYNLPYRINNKLFRTYKSLIGKSYVRRNWELQFIGRKNDAELQKWLFQSNLDQLIDIDVISKYYNNFKVKDALTNAHPVSMLLTLSLFFNKFHNV